DVEAEPAVRGHRAQVGLELAQPFWTQAAGPLRAQVLEDRRGPGQRVDAERGEPDQLAAGVAGVGDAFRAAEPLAPVQRLPRPPCWETPGGRPTSLAVAPSRPIACIANPWAGRMPGWPRAASSACSASMSARNPPNSSSGSSNPGVSGSSGSRSVANLDNLVYGIDNHVVYRSPAGACPVPASGGTPCRASRFPTT